MRIETVAIVGASELGCRLAYLALRGGLRMVLEDVSISALEKGVGAIRGMFEGASNSLRVDSGCVAFDVAAGNLETARSVEEAVREADLIVEAVADELEMKLELFTIFDKFAKPGAIFASTTETIRIAELAEMTVCPERCVGMRMESAEGARRVRLVRGKLTSEETMASCREVARRMDLDVSVVDER
jgi:3-hydroxybutyryl-CoA dehydrogenase